MQLCVFCGGDGSDPDHIWRCDGRQGKVEAAYGKTRTTAEAMTLLRATRQRQIEDGRRIAREQILADGFTHSRKVRDEMQRQGLIDPLVKHDHWLGAVFHDPDLAWTGEWHTHHSSARNIHERTIKVWTLRRLMTA